MKQKLMVLTNLLFFVSLLFFACNDPEKKVIDKSRCSDCTEYNNIKASSKLDVNLLKAMTLNYQKNPLTGQIDTNKTRSVWISLEKLKQFVYDIEKGTCKCDGSRLGVRVYFGIYPDDQDWVSTTGFKNDLNNPGAPDGDFRGQIIDRNQSANRPPINDYAKIMTIFMVPTIGTGSVNYDFDPADNPNGCKGGYNLETFYRKMAPEKFNDTAIFLHSSAGTSITALSATNHGDACPPPVKGCQALGSFKGFDH